eukprot:TRINITY_DN3087_c0_g1_i2.p1 TRINITY_DN3087_c0_g1~~TRINITY_DN3087_c0_g1_i2.p1  ORF type:complete len:142 (+),score=22.73 TRINITY_DN3087_c0_g1_i2:70-495(+)
MWSQFYCIRFMLVAFFFLLYRLSFFFYLWVFRGGVRVVKRQGFFFFFFFFFFFAKWTSLNQGRHRETMGILHVQTIEEFIEQNITHRKGVESQFWDGNSGQNNLVQAVIKLHDFLHFPCTCLLYTSPSPRDLSTSRMPSSA